MRELEPADVMVAVLAETVLAMELRARMADAGMPTEQTIPTPRPVRRRRRQ